MKNGELVLYVSVFTPYQQAIGVIVVDVLGDIILGILFIHLEYNSPPIRVCFSGLKVSALSLLTMLTC